MGIKGTTIVTAQAVALLLLASAVALTTNALRDGGIPLVMPFPPTYQCPSSETAGVPMDLQKALGLFGMAGTVFVDARKTNSFRLGHIEGARHIPYSYVEPVPKETVDSLAGARSVIVYCNRRDSEASRLLAGELAQAGLKSVAFLEKGFAGWVKAGGPYTGKAPESYDE